MAAIGCAWAMLQGGYLHAQWIPTQLENTDLALEIEIQGLPAKKNRFWDFRARIAKTPLELQKLIGKTIKLGFYDPKVPLRAGDLITGTVRLKRPRGMQNLAGFDFEQYALAKGWVGVGYLKKIDEIRHCRRCGLDVYRWETSQWIARLVSDPRNAALLQALAIGEQGALAADDWQVIRDTSTAHLIAISGFHIGMVAAFGMVMMRLVFWMMPALGLWLPRSICEAAFGAALALLYALIAGWSLPVQRTALAILILMAAKASRRFLPLHRAFGLCLLAVLLVDPLAGMEIGFWLSFAGVGFLLFCFSGRPAPNPVTGFIRAQAIMTVALLPIAAWFFRQFAPIGFIANLAAVPLISMAAAPLTVLGVLVREIHAPTADLLLRLASECAAWFWWMLERCVAVQGQVWAVAPPTAWIALLACIGALLLFLPKAASVRLLGAAMFLPLFFPRYAPLRHGEIEGYVFDVGQGLSVLLRTRGKSLLFDAGSGGANAFDIGEAVLTPALWTLGVRRLDALVVSHGDNDHAGGAAAVMRNFEPRTIYAGPDVALGNPCARPIAWTWDGVRFEFLHPPQGFPALGNDSACVLRATIGDHAVLIPADISKAVEARLVNAHADGLKADVLIVPHHGSATSSTASFLSAVRPKLAIASEGYLNRFRHPASEVVARYAAQCIPLLRTSQAGMIGFRLDGRGLSRVDARREARRAFWYDAGDAGARSMHAFDTRQD